MKPPKQMSKKKRLRQSVCERERREERKKEREREREREDILGLRKQLKPKICVWPHQDRVFAKKF